MLYCFRQFSINGIQPVKIAKEPLTDYLIYNDEFKKRLSAKLSDLFNPEIPFTPIRIMTPASIASSSLYADKQ